MEGLRGSPISEQFQALIDFSAQEMLSRGRDAYLSALEILISEAAGICNDDRPKSPLRVRHGPKLSYLLDAIKKYVQHDDGPTCSEVGARAALVRRLRGYADQLEADLATTDKVV